MANRDKDSDFFGFIIAIVLLNNFVGRSDAPPSPPPRSRYTPPPPRNARADGVGGPSRADYIAIGGHAQMTLDELRTCFRRTIRQAHPDVVRGDDANADAAHIIGAWERIERYRLNPRAARAG